jgi:hypothetical protein
MASSTTGRSSIGNSGSASSVIRRRPRHCLCGEEVRLKTVGDILSVNYGKKFWGCRNWRRDSNAGCDFFKWFDDDVVDERDLKIARQKKKNGKLKNEVCVLKNELLSTQKWLKISTGFGCLCFGINLVLVTIILYSGRLISNPSMYLRG